MALWQFDCYIIPREICVAEIDLSDEDILSWKQDNISLVRIDFLEKKASWSDKIVQYGKEDKTCIQFLYEDDFLKEINCRLDLRSLSKKMLHKILDYIQKIDGIILYKEKIYPPIIDVVVELLKKSDENKFCQNPENYFEELSNN